MKTNSLLAALNRDLDEQVATTRNFLTLVPEDRFDWAPHEKSMKMVNLASHIAELPGWAKLAAETDELDFATSPYTPAVINRTQDLLDLLEKSYAEGNEALKNVNENDLGKTWILRNGSQILVETSKADMIRVAINQIVHHRAQLGVYFRLLGIPVPQSFGPTADTMSF
jgi:uncharacterized damage-inducible protein DinB